MWGPARSHRTACTCTTDLRVSRSMHAVAACNAASAACMAAASFAGVRVAAATLAAISARLAAIAARDWSSSGLLASELFDSCPSTTWPSASGEERERGSN